MEQTDGVDTLPNMDSYAKISYSEAWKALANLLTDLRKGGETIPENVMNDLRSAKTMIQILKADPTHIEILPRIETYLENVESYLIFAAQKRFGSEYTERWMRKLEKAKGKIEEARTVSKFVPGLPRDKHWVRIQASEDIPQKDIERLAEENELLHKAQKNGYVLVYGDGEKIKTFVKKMAEKFRGRRKG